jgi:hypothetical protein
MRSYKNRSLRFGIFSLSQKGFIPRVNSCGEHSAIENISPNRAIKAHKMLDIFALDMRDYFGSVSNIQLRNNLH